MALSVAWGLAGSAGSLGWVLAVVAVAVADRFGPIEHESGIGECLVGVGRVSSVCTLKLMASASAGIRLCTYVPAGEQSPVVIYWLYDSSLLVYTDTFPFISLYIKNTSPPHMDCSWCAFL